MEHTAKSAADLALHGGEKVRKTPFPSRHNFGTEEKAAIDALFEQSIASGVAPGYNGEEEEAYCAEFATLMGGGYVDAVNSGTTALYVALKALDLEPFSEVIVGAVTDPGGIMPIPLLNLVPVVADTVPGSYNTGPEQIAPLITSLTRAIVVPHIAGEPADVIGIVALAERRGIPVIEDVSQSHGATLRTRMLGSIGAIGCFSTMSGKHHASGAQGGLVYTRDERLYQASRRASDRGKPFFLPPGSTNAIASLNLNLNDISAAIGRAQLAKLPGIVARRRAIVKKLTDGIRDLVTVSPPRLIDGAEASYWFLRMHCNVARMTCDKATYCEALLAERLPLNPSYSGALPHTMDWFVNRRVFGTSGYPWSSPDYKGNRNWQFPCPNAQAVMDTDFNLHLHENWGEQEIKDALAIFRKVDAAYRA